MRFPALSRGAAQGVLQLQLRVKPGASKSREGVTVVGDDAIELCVAAQAKDGEANQAVIRLLSDILGIPKSNITLSRGMKSRDKTVLVQSVLADDSDYETTILDLLRRAIDA